MFIAVTNEDETISIPPIMQYFDANQHPASRLLMFSAHEKKYNTNKIVVENARIEEARIDHFSHRSLLFSPNNPHYGKEGDYVLASHAVPTISYGAYAGTLGHCYQLLYSLDLTKQQRRELTYNPKFDLLSEQLINFIYAATNK
jgi:hypothetical protein